MDILQAKDNLVREISKCEAVKGIAQTGHINAKLVPGQSDIDLFVLCTNVPVQEERKRIYSMFSDQYSECILNVCNGGNWGYGDILLIGGIEIMPMYFTIDEMESYLKETLQGKHLGMIGGFYPTGRLSSVETINVLYEEDSTWTDLKEIVKRNPSELFEKLYQHHITRVLNDEDLGIVILRKEVLFYHQVLESSLDHLLQALFALNHTYFPSRKRMEEYIHGFENKPINCYGRLLKIIEMATSSETMEESVSDLKELTREIQNAKFIIKQE
jgi:hypothetical protein